MAKLSVYIPDPTMHGLKEIVKDSQGKYKNEKALIADIASKAVHEQEAKRNG